ARIGRVAQVARGARRRARCRTGRGARRQRVCLAPFFPLTPLEPHMKSEGATNARPYAALALLALIWGHTGVGVKLASSYFGPLDFAALRTPLGAALRFVLVAARGVALRPQHAAKAFWLGMFQTGGFVGLISAALVSGTA